MRKRTIHILPLCMLLCLLTCIKKSTGPEKSGTVPEGQIYQVPGCAGPDLTKSSFPDSCFSYTFDTNLTVEFCVTANCCPDSNRFRLAYELRSDTIAVAVQDTAPDLCYCICPYTIHMELIDLSLDHYVFICDYDGSILYTEDIWREDNEE